MKTPRAAGLLMIVMSIALIAADQPADKSADHSKAQTDAIHVSGADIATPADWTPARMKSDLADEIKTIEYSSHGQTHHSTAVPLLSILKTSGLATELKHDPTADPRTKHIPLRLTVTVIGKDGYAASFALAEMLPSVGKNPIWLAIDADGTDLPAAEGPAKLIVPSDGEPGRWVHGVAAVVVSDPVAASTQP